MLCINIGLLEVFEEMNRVIEQRDMRPAIGGRLGFEEAQEACPCLDIAAPRGKVTIRM